jgi:ubiquitin C-terminal hydrolase
LNFFLGRVDDELKNPKAKESVMMDLFGIDQYQEVKCDTCNTVTKRTEPLLGLMLSLPDENEGMEGIEEDADAVTSEPEIDLLECFKSLQTTGRFEGENQYDCDTCKAKQDASWSVSLQRRPQSILISLRRTLWNVEKGLHKDSRNVKFPIELDCSGLLDLDKGRTSPDEDFEGCHYKLNSVVSHSGSSPFVGHYISWCRVDDKWFLFNDSSVTESNEADVLAAQAFILLYERQRIPSAGSNEK